MWIDLHKNAYVIWQYFCKGLKFHSWHCCEQWVNFMPFGFHLDLVILHHYTFRHSQDGTSASLNTWSHPAWPATEWLNDRQMDVRSYKNFYTPLESFRDKRWFETLRGGFRISHFQYQDLQLTNKFLTTVCNTIMVYFHTRSISIVVFKRKPYNQK